MEVSQVAAAWHLLRKAVCFIQHHIFVIASIQMHMLWVQNLKRKQHQQYFTSFVPTIDKISIENVSVTASVTTLTGVTTIITHFLSLYRSAMHLLSVSRGWGEE
jgi:hypothetical protein